MPVFRRYTWVRTKMSFWAFTTTKVSFGSFKTSSVFHYDFLNCSVSTLKGPPYALHDHFYIQNIWDHFTYNFFQYKRSLGLIPHAKHLFCTKNSWAWRRDGLRLWTLEFIKGFGLYLSFYTIHWFGLL